MIRIRMDFSSVSLRMATSAVVLMPHDNSEDIGTAAGRGPSAEGAPVLYLLHGLSDDCTAWERRTSLERYVAGTGMAVVMPEVRRSFYADEVYGEAYWTFIAHELPELIARTFHISTRRKDTFVAGLSMGGFGAMKLALTYPERFAAAGSFSGALDMRERQFLDRHGTLEARVWGETNAGASRRHLPAGDDLLGLIDASTARELPDLWIGCGRDDELLGHTQRFVAAARAHGITHTAVLSEGGHTWDVWDDYLERFLTWLSRAGVSGRELPSGGTKLAQQRG